MAVVGIMGDRRRAFFFAKDGTVRGHAGMRTGGCLNQVNIYIYTVCSKGSRLVQGEACCWRVKYDACVTVTQSAAWAGYDTAGN